MLGINYMVFSAFSCYCLLTCSVVCQLLRELRSSKESISELLSFWHPCCTVEQTGVQGAVSVGADRGETMNHRRSFHSDNVQTMSSLWVMAF